MPSGPSVSEWVTETLPPGAELRAIRGTAGFVGYLDGVPVTGRSNDAYMVADRIEAVYRAATARRRPCLRCRKDFASTGAGHRLCDSCAGRSAETGDGGHGGRYPR